MSQLSKAPLLEAIVELHWGTIEKKDDSISLKFEADDLNFFPGQFRAVAAVNGFSHVEQINPNLFPKTISYRFRRNENTWPCYQIGLGIFTVNQVSNGYDWATFKEDAIAGVKMLDDGHPLKLAKLPVMEIMLRYQDAFILEDDESPSDFLKNKFEIGFIPPDIFLQAGFIRGNVQGHNIGFQVETSEPEGLLRFEIVQAIVNVKPGFVMNTLMRSKISELTPEFFAGWLESAHAAQKHAFSTLINPTYLKSLK